MDENKSPSAAPVPKVAVAGATGAIVTILVWAVKLGGVEVPPEVAAALATIFAFGAGYFTPPSGFNK